MTDIALDPMALDALKNRQRQLDADGCEVGVSRQALDELIAAYEADASPAQVAPANPAQVTDEMVEAACAAWDDAYEAEIKIGSSAYSDNKEIAMRAALTAAIGAGGQTASDEVLALMDNPPVIGAGGQAVAWRVSCPDDEIYGRGPDTVRFHPLSPDEIASGYTQQPLYTHPAPSGQAVQDTWFTDRALPVKAMSGDVEDNRVLRLHFRRPVTDDDRKSMCDALNLHQASLSQPHPADERVVEALWHPLTHKDDKMTCPTPADETVVEVMLQDGTVCPAWYSCNIMEAGDWDFLPVKDDGEPDDEADSIASRIVAWRALSAKEGR